MAIDTTFGQIETKIRRDLINDNYDEAYRWKVAAVMAAMNEAVMDVVTRYNSWAGYNQDTGRRIYNINTTEIVDACNGLPPNTDIADSVVNNLRQLTMPIDSRYAPAVAYLAAAKLLEIDDSDTANAQKVAALYERGRGYAQT